MSSLYDRLGGAAAIEVAVDKFYDRVLADDRINFFFANTDMKKQRDHQKKFLTFAFGGANNFNGRNMRLAHKKLVDDMGLNASHFDAVVENLGATLKDLSIADELITEVVSTAETLRDDVLNR